MIDALALSSLNRAFLYSYILNLKLFLTLNIFTIIILLKSKCFNVDLFLTSYTGGYGESKSTGHGKLSPRTYFDK